MTICQSFSWIIFIFLFKKWWLFSFSLAFSISLIFFKNPLVSCLCQQFVSVGWYWLTLDIGNNFFDVSVHTPPPPLPKQLTEKLPLKINLPDEDSSFNIWAKKTLLVFLSSSLTTNFIRFVIMFVCLIKSFYFWLSHKSKPTREKIICLNDFFFIWISFNILLWFFFNDKCFWK